MDVEQKANEIRDRFCPPGDYDYSDILDAIKAALTPPQGYVLVPVEPTQEMLNAGYGFESEYPVDPFLYRAMLAARPEVKP